MIDAHCHILPGLDDGVSNIEETESILSQLNKFNIDKLVFTSHIKNGFAEYDEHVNAYKQVKPIANKYNIQTALGFELGWKKLADIGYQNAKKYCFENSNLLLLEFSIASLPANWQNMIYKLQGEGIKVIIAHPERYKALYDDFSVAEEMHEMGCLFMLSANFINKHFFMPYLKKSAKKLLKAGLVDMICSDAHSIEGFEWIEPANKFAMKYDFNINKNEYYLQDIF